MSLGVATPGLIFLLAVRSVGPCFYKVLSCLHLSRPLSRLLSCGNFAAFSGTDGGFDSRSPVVAVVPIATGKPFITRVRLVTVAPDVTEHLRTGAGSDSSAA